MCVCARRCPLWLRFVWRSVCAAILQNIAEDAACTRFGGLRALNLAIRRTVLQLHGIAVRSRLDAQQSKTRCGHTLPEIFGLQEALPVPTPRHLQPARHLSANDRHFAMRTPSKVSVRCHHRLGTLWRRLGKMLSAGDVWVQTCLGLGRSFRELDGLTIRGWLGFQVTVAWLLVSFWRNLMTTFLSPLCC